MTSQGWQRARQPEQKAARATAILEAAATLFDERDLDKISMGDIAHLAGLGKASLYHYFKTKEEVFLRLYLDALPAWIETLGKRISALGSESAPDGIAQAIVESLEGNSRICRLSAVLTTRIETNITLDVMRSAKGEMLESATKFAQLLREVLPDISEASAIEFTIQLHVCMSGFWQVANPVGVASEAVELPEFTVFRPAFAPILRRTLSALLAQSCQAC